MSIAALVEFHAYQILKVMSYLDDGEKRMGAERVYLSCIKRKVETVAGFLGAPSGLLSVHTLEEHMTSNFFEMLLKHSVLIQNCRLLNLDGLKCAEGWCRAGMWIAW